MNEICKKCNQVFEKAKDGRCKFCERERSRKQYSKLKTSSEKSPEFFRDYWLKKRYKISLNEFRNIVKQQDSKCAICNSEDPKTKNREFVLDHCHETKRIRGVLCNECNIGLGKFKDNTDVLTKAIQYLKKN